MRKVLEVFKKNYKKIQKDIEKLEKKYESHVESKNLYSGPVVLGFLALSYLGLRTYLGHKLGVSVEDLEPVQQQIMNIMDITVGITTYIGLFGALPATLCCKLDALSTKKQLEKKKKELEDLL